MKYIFKKDNRDKFWTKLEKNIQNSALKKDKRFVLSGKWKKYVRRQDGFKVYLVDGEWIRNNLSVTFGHGGHGYVHEFIPNDEIWVEKNHPESINNIKKGEKMSKKFIDSTIIHEMTEFKEMKKGLNYWKAHQIALEEEKELGLLKDPYKEIK